MSRLMLVLTFCVFQIQAHDNALSSNLYKEYVQQVAQENRQTAQILSKAFDVYSNSSKNVKMHDLLDNIHLHNLFSLSVYRSGSTDQSSGEQGAQSLMLVFLYTKMFKETIAQAEQFVDQLSRSLDYWRMEKFNISLPMVRKHPMYWLFSPEYKQKIKEHVKALELVEQDITRLLGMALYGRYEISKIQDDKELLTKLEKSIQPLYEYFNLKFGDNAHTACLFKDGISLHTSIRIDCLFKDALWLNEGIQKQFEQNKLLLTEHVKPPHLIEHAFFYGCLASGILAGYGIYKAHEQDIPEYQRKGKDAVANFVQEYIKIPLCSLKDILWDNKIQELPKLKQPKPMEIEDIRYQFEWMTKVRKEVNDGKRFVNETISNSVDFIRESAEITNKTVLRNQQVNFHLAAIGPVIIVSYLMYRGIMGMYNHHVTHEAWHQPMRLLIREIDRVLNRLVAQQKRSYADDGLLYIFVLRMQSFIYCLPNEELRLIKQDLKELLAYDLTYQQKRGVITRMYETYSFLKKLSD